jgi:hypothetical protein
MALFILSLIRIFSLGSQTIQCSLTSIYNQKAKNDLFSSTKEYLLYLFIILFHERILFTF